MAGKAVLIEYQGAPRLVESRLFIRNLGSKPIWQEWGTVKVLPSLTRGELGGETGRQPAPEADRRDVARQAARIVGLHHYSAERAGSFRDLEPLAGHLADETGDRRSLLHADDRIIVAAHAGIRLIARPGREDLAIGSRHMAMRPDDERDATVEEVTHRHLLGRSLAMDVDDDRVDVAKRMRGDRRLDRGKWIIKRIHEQTRHNIDHEDPPTLSDRVDEAAMSRRPGRKIGGAKQAEIAGDIRDDLATVPDMIAGGDRVDPGGIELGADLVGDAETGGGILPIDDDEIERQRAAQTRQVFDHARPSRTADDVAAEQNPHRGTAGPPQRRTTMIGEVDGAATAVGIALPPWPAYAGGNHIPVPRHRQGQSPRSDNRPQGICDLTRRAAPSILYLVLSSRTATASMRAARLSMPAASTASVAEEWSCADVAPLPARLRSRRRPSVASASSSVMIRLAISKRRASPTCPQVLANSPTLPSIYWPSWRIRSS